MLFDSWKFAGFLIVFILLYYNTGKRLQLLWLLVASVLFYVWGSRPQIICVPLAMIALTYLTAIQMASTTSERRKQALFLFSVCLQVAILVFYKYALFIIDSASHVLHSMRLSPPETVPGHHFFAGLIVPLGLSYILFQAIGYLVEVKRGELAAERDVLKFSSYLLFFPKIIAGPVENAKHFLPQLQSPVPFSYDAVTAGTRQLAWGLFKKIIIAERLAVFTNHVYGDVQGANGISFLVALIVFPVQLYADFSGYTDMAIGIAKTMGYDLGRNFNQPFAAKSMTEFWRRWHISLSSWFNEYFYMPLAIKMRDWGKWGLVLASLFTFFVLGLWHGANWTFVWFGLINGVYLAIEFLTTRSRKRIRKALPGAVNDIGGMIYVFLAFAFALVFFRAPTVSDATYVFAHFFSGGLGLQTMKTTLQGIGLTGMDYIVCFITIPFMFYVERTGLVQKIAARPQWQRWSLYYVFLCFLVAYGISSGAGFIYQQF